MASFAVGGVAPVMALPTTQHLSGTFDFGGPISTLPVINPATGQPYTPGELNPGVAAPTATGQQDPLAGATGTTGATGATTSSDGGFVNARRAVTTNNSEGNQSAPSAAAPTAAAPPAAAAGVPGAAAPVAATGPTPPGAPAGTSQIPGTAYIGATGNTTAPVFDPATGGMTVPGTTMTQGTTPADQAALVKQALGPGVSVGVGNLAGFNPDGTPIVSTPPTQVGGGTPAPANEIPTFQNFRNIVASNIAQGTVTAAQGTNPIGMGPGGIPIYGK